MKLFPTKRSKSKMVYCKCTLVGDDFVGKRYLIAAYTKKEIPQPAPKAAFESYAEEMVVDGKPISLALWDTVDSTESDQRLRPLGYPDTNVFVICFSLDSPSSLEHVESKWFPEVYHHNPGTPIILLGTKLDLRDDPLIIDKLNQDHLAPIHYAQGVHMAKSINAVKYLECSALSQVGVAQVFEEAMRVVLNPGSRKVRSGPVCRLGPCYPH